MKTIMRTITKQIEEEVKVCDTCEQEKPLLVGWMWDYVFPGDEFNNDFIECNFCSTDCFLKGMRIVTDSLKDKKAFFTLKFGLKYGNDNGWDGYETSNELLKILNKLAGT